MFAAIPSDVFDRLVSLFLVDKNRCYSQPGVEMRVGGFESLLWGFLIQFRFNTVLAHVTRNQDDGCPSDGLD